MQWDRNGVYFVGESTYSAGSLDKESRLAETASRFMGDACIDG